MFKVCPTALGTCEVCERNPKTKYSVEYQKQHHRFCLRHMVEFVRLNSQEEMAISQAQVRRNVERRKNERGQ